MGHERTTQTDRPDSVNVAPRRIPPFYVLKTLGPGNEPRVTLHMPEDKEFILRELGEKRSPDDAGRWNRLAAELSTLWLKR
jgi:hypothetical protein